MAEIDSTDFPLTQEVRGSGMTSSPGLSVIGPLPEVAGDCCSSVLEAARVAVLPAGAV